MTFLKIVDVMEDSRCVDVMDNVFIIHVRADARDIVHIIVQIIVKGSVLLILPCQLHAQWLGFFNAETRKMPT